MNIKPLQEKKEPDFEYPIFLEEEVRQLEANFEEAMKELLIECMNNYENMYVTRGNVKKIYADDIGIIEKATGKKWEDLINDKL